MSAQAVIERILLEKLVAVVRADSAEQATEAAAAAFRGGISFLEITFTVPGAARSIEQLRKQLPEATVGAGSICTMDQADIAVRAGAQFFVSPHSDAQLIRWFQERQLLYIPGGFTSSELMAGWKAGCRLLKLSPASVGGAEMLRAILQPLPFLRVVATGGVDASNAVDYLRAGAAALGVGGSLFRSFWLKTRDWKAIEAASAELARIIREFPGG